MTQPIRSLYSTIKNLFSSANNFSISWIIFLAAFSIGFSYLHTFGIYYGSDSTYYIRAAHVLLQSGFDFSSLSSQGYPFFYWFYPVFLTLFGGNFTLVVLAQIFLHSIAAVLIFHLASRLFNKITGIFSGFGYVLLWEVFQWDMYILTDSLFLFTLVLSAFLGLLALEKKSPLFWIAFLFTVLITLFLRPTVFPFFAAVVLFLAWHIPLKYKLTTIGIGALLFGWIIFNIIFQTSGPQLGLAPYLNYFSSLFEKGILVRDRSAFIIPVEWLPGFNFSNILLFLKLFISKIFLFWSPIAPEFSFGHKVVSLLTFIPLIILGFFGMLQGLTNIHDPNKYRFIIFLSSIIIFFWIFQSFTEIDYDWRYRLPVLPFMVIFASYGFSLFLKKVYIFYQQRFRC